MSSSRERDAERRAEQAFRLQQEQINLQKKLVQQQNAQAQSVIDSINQTQASTQPARDLALQDLQASIEGKASPVLNAFLEDTENRGANSILRNFGPGGETSSGAIELRKALELMKAEAVDQTRQGNINSALNATNSLETAADRQLQMLLSAGNQPLQGSQVLGQSVANLGTLSQYNRPRDTFARDIGISAIRGLGSQPNAFSNVANNLSFLTSPFRSKTPLSVQSFSGPNAAANAFGIGLPFR